MSYNVFIGCKFSDSNSVLHQAEKIQRMKRKEHNRRKREMTGEAKFASQRVRDETNRDRERGLTRIDQD